MSSSSSLNLDLSKSNELQRIIFEDINDDFGYGNYGEFRVIIMKKNGYINVTKLCSLAKKQFCHWKTNKFSTEFLNAVNFTG
jgi:hypothetical protein